MDDCEAPLTSGGETKDIIENLKKFEASYKDNIKYEVSIYKKENNLFIETDIPKDCIKIKYSNRYDIKTLKQNNKFFTLYDSIENIIDAIYDSAVKNSCNIAENYDDYQIKIALSLPNIKGISFILKKIEKPQSEIIIELNFNVAFLQKKVENQNKKIIDLERKVKELEDQNKRIAIDLRDSLKKEIIEALRIENLNSKSKIINYHSFTQLNNWISPKKLLKFKLIYTASLNGDTAENFHYYCDKKGPTVTIIKGKNGHIFGGYVTVPFSSDGLSHYDDKAFLFSLTNKKKFPIKIKEEAVCHYYKSWGPYFGYKDICDLGICSGCLQKKNCICQPKSYKFQREELIGIDEKYFEIDDYEVFLVN